MRVAVTMATLALCAAPGLAFAQERSTDDSFTWNGAVAAGNTVRIRNLAGTINVERSTSSRVEVTGRKEWRNGDPADVRFEAVPQSDGVTICAIWYEGRCTDDRPRSGPRRDDDNRNNDVRVVFTVKLPAGVRLEASGVSSDVNVTGATAGVTANSVSGDLTLTDVAGEIRVNSVSGEVRITGATTDAIRANTVSGDIEITLRQLGGTGDLNFSTVSGDVDITFPQNLDATVRMNTVSGGLQSDFPMTMQGEQRRRNMEVRIGAGGRVLNFNSVSGDVTLRRR